MRPVSLLACATAICVLGGTAIAEPPTGSRLGDWRQSGPTISDRDQAIGARKMAKCLLNREEPLVRAVLLARDPQVENSNATKLMGEIRCFSGAFANDLVEERHVYYPHDILRGMLAEAALDRLAAQEKAKVLKPLPIQATYAREWFAVTSRHVSVDEMGACIADTNPAGIITLISTEPLGKDESVAFSGLSASLGKCLRAGTRLQASRQALRAALADALFQRLNRPESAPGTAE